MMPRDKIRAIQEERMKQMQPDINVPKLIKDAQKGGMMIGFCLGFGIGVLAIEIVVHIL